MVRITEELVRKRAEHNEREIGTLEELSLHQEDIEKIEHLQHWCRDLRILLLQNNLISKIENLKKLKKLEYLNLTLNNVEKIENLEGCESLKKLDLTMNFIGDVTSIKNLEKNSFLEELYLTGNPCTDYTGYRDYVITVVPQLQSLDGTQIYRSERIQALQNFDTIKYEILFEQDEYERKREKQREAALSKMNVNKGVIITEVEEDDDDDDEREKKNKNEALDPESEKAFWSQSSENTPETRIEIANRIRKTKELKERNSDDNKKQKRILKFFNKDGRPYNINEAKIDFLFTEDDANNCYLLELHVYRYLDTTLIDVDVQPNYVRALIKGKVFQLALDEEVKTGESTAKRSQTTGHLLINMPKVKGSLTSYTNVKTNRPEIKKNDDTKSSQVQAFHDRRRELLEIGSGIREMDYTKICENNALKKYDGKTCATTKKLLKRKDIKEKIPSKDFIDDSQVPPLW